jgi:hypothetical protein
MRKYFALTIALFAVFCAPPALADKKPINLNQVKPIRQDKCLIKVVAFINGKPYAFSRLRGMEYTLPDGTEMTAANPKHPWNDCDITDIGEVSRFSTGLMKKNGLNVHIDALATDAAKKKFITTYADRHAPIMEKFQKDDYERMADFTNWMKWSTSTMFLLPASAATQNEEPVAIYCKLPANVKADDRTLTRAQRRKLCTTRYILPGGLGFGYTFLESEKEYKPTDIDRAAREYFAGTPVKQVKAAPKTP